MKSFLLLLLLLILFMNMNGGFFTLGLKHDANMMVWGSCSEKERQALLITKASLVDSYGELDGWGSNEENRDCCLWVGVHCDNLGHVITIDLGLKKLNGTLSSSVCQLLYLGYLYVNSNNLNGSIPDFTKCPSLSTLDLSHNGFTGTLPSSLGQLLKLDRLDVSHNSLNGGIPDFTRCPSLSTLDLSHNGFTGTLPSSLGQLLHVNYLDISHNSLNGNIPDFTGCPHLSSLHLSSNNFTGDLPSSLGQISNLRILDVSHNSLNGNIPGFTGYLSIRSLDLSHNNLTGNLPSSVGQLSSLLHLDVSSNSLNGVISDLHFHNLTRLSYLDLSFNSFSFELWSIPSQLDKIKLQSCMLGPNFPSWLKAQTNFTHLDISSAGISHRIPSWFWDHLPSQLYILNISSNEIKDVLPDVTTNFVNYPGVDLSNNQFEGRVPLLPSKVAALNLSGNKLSGNLSFLCQIDEEINFIDLSNNSFTGSLPDCWSKFQKKLTILNLSNNKLSGRIPSSLGSLSHLEALYLRNNTFVGELPMSLSNCTKLRFVDFGENKLSGMIPAWIGERLTELYVIVLRSNRFFGSIPTQVCWLYNLQLLDFSNNRLSGNIPQCVGNLTAMATKRFGDDMSNHFYSSYETTFLQTRGIGYYGKPFVDTVSGENLLFIDNALVAWKGKVREFGRTGLDLLKSIDLSNNNFSGVLPNEITNLVELVSLNFSSNKLHGEVPREIGQLKSLNSLDLSRNDFSGRIPSSLSWVVSFGYLDLSNNNFSGEIPIGSQLQLFNSSFYSGNPLLCGLPLTRQCGIPDTDPNDGKKDDVEEDESEVWESYYMGIGVGFVFGFWGICGAVFVNRGCRHFLFASPSHVIDWIYITMALYLRKFKRF